MMDVPQAIERALELSQADSCVVMGSRNSSANIRWANNTSTTNGETRSMSISVLSIKGKKTGLVTQTVIPGDDIEAIVRLSEEACEGRPDADDYSPLVEGTADDGWREPEEPTSVGVFASFAPALGDLFRRADGDDHTLYGYAEHGSTTTWLGSSAGLRKRNTFVRGSVDFTGKSADRTRSSWAGAFSKTFKDVPLDDLYEQIARRLEWAKTKIAVPAGRTEVLLSPACVADMVYYMHLSSTRREADEGRSVFSKQGGGNRVGERLFAPGISLYSDPHEPGLDVPPFSTTLASTSYGSAFDAGMPKERVGWARDGVLTDLITTRDWARKSGAQKAVPFVGNICVEGQGATLDDMIARTERALLVNCFWYIRTVDPQTLLLTGLTRDGVFLVENGEVKGAANNFRFNMSPVQMLADTIEVGGSAVTLPREFEAALTKAPPLRVADFNMSSVSDAT